MARVIREGGVRLFGVVAISAILVVAGVLYAGGNGNGNGTGPGIYPPHVAGEVLIKLTPGSGPAEHANAMAQVQAQKRHTFRSGAERWTLGSGWNVEQAIAALRNNPHVAYVEPNYLVSLEAAPDDPRYPELYGMNNTGQTGGTPGADIDAERAWNVSTGSHAVVVAVIDTGIDRSHPDLAANIWTNPGEIPDNGIDDDNNGFIDDVHGWDFVNNDNDSTDDNGHGTHCSGTIGAVGNNAVGVAGVNWNVSLVGLKFLNAGGSGSTADAVSAIDYGTMMGVDVMSNSWGGGGFSQTMLDAINAAAAAQVVFVAAAGNSNTNNDVSPHYPSNYDAPNVISVAATDDNDGKASFSSYGATTVDLGAPGVDILSTLPGNSYGLLSGTSMATPHVSGVVALMRSVAPDLPAVQLKSVLLSFAEPVPSLTGITVTGGRLNAFFPIAEPDDVPPGMVDDLATDGSTSNSIFLAWSATGDDGSDGTASGYDVRYSTAPIDDTNFDAAMPAAGAPLPGPFGSPESMEVLGLDPDTTYYFALKAADEWGNMGPISNTASGTTLPPPVFASTPDLFQADLLSGQSTNSTLTVVNAGPGTLDWTIPLPAVSGPMVEQQPFLDLGKGETDPRVGSPVTLGFGGPDMFGYRWTDSDEAGGPTFVWNDISASGTPIAELTGDDQTSSPIPLGFNFPFYGGTVDSVRVCTNGWISFTSTATSYSNQPLPNSGAPTSVIAPFWDDLHFRGAAHATYDSDGSRFIVQFTDVDTYATGSNLTFQVEIRSSGEILFHYLTMAGTLDSATLGIQNEARTDGLTVAFNTAYVHDALSVRIAAIPQWLTASPTSGRLYPGESASVDVQIDATGLDGGTYEGDVRVDSNDPTNPSVSHPVTLQVTGAPAISVVPGALDFGLVFTGFDSTMQLSVNNTGTDTLTVSGIVAGNAAVAVSPSSFMVPAHSSQIVDVTFAPMAPMTLSTDLTISSDASNAANVIVGLTGMAAPPPIVLTSPTSFSEQLFTGGSVGRNLRIRNTGGSDLEVGLSVDLGALAQNADLFVALPKGDESDAGAGGIQTEGSGGPDGFGYRWKDSDESGGPSFSWIDISGSGTQISFPSSDDSLSAVISMGMLFPFYGNDFSDIKVSTNGWLTFNTAYTGSSLAGNGSMPSTSLPQNSIALMWDDLHLRSGAVYYQFDGTRFILQYNHVGRFTPSTGQDYSFQVQLYPGGKIVLQYLTLTGTLNSATVGIQDSTRTIATQVVYNSAYLHDALAVDISRVPDWLSVTPTSGVIPPGGFQDFGVTFDAGDSGDRTFVGFVNLATNIPGQELVAIPATLQVFGVADVAVQPEMVDYGTRFLGFPHLVGLAVHNAGTADLTVSSVTSDDPTLSVDEPPASNAVFVISPGGAILYNLRWTPTVAGALSATVTVASDDPDEPTLTIPVTGNAIPAPVLGYSPGSYAASLYVGEQETHQMTLTNSGGSDLEYQIGVRLTNALVVPIESKELAKGEEPGPGGEPSILGAGGPDMFGYRWKDSDEPGGPTFDWTDISGVGTPIAGLDGDDENVGPIDIGFSFPFYGDTFDTVRVCTNGWVSFTSTSTAYSNAALPGSSSTPNNLLAAFWDDLHFRSMERATYYNDGSRFIIQFTDVDRIGTTTTEHYTFQVILYPTGKIVYQYLTMDGQLDSATIGIQNEARDDGLTIVHNASYVHDEMAIEIQAIPDWLSVSPASGVIPAGGSATVNVQLNATELIGGLYSGGLTLTTNDPAHASNNIPCTLDVTGFPGIAADPTAVDFGNVYIGVASSLDVEVSNPGSDLLNVTEIAVTGDYSTDTTPFSLVPGSSRILSVEFAPTTDGTRDGSLTLTSNATGMPTLAVSLTGEGVYPPIVGIDVESFEVALPPAGDTTRTLRIDNSGGSDLEWNASTDLLSILGEAAPVYPELDLAKDEADPRPGLLGTGGPDGFGYRWVDSDEAGGPAFDWVDISADGTPVSFSSSDDGLSDAIPIGMNFPFYGNTFNELWLSTNGWGAFTDPSSSDLSNDPLPSSGGPINLLGMFWDDLHLRTGTVYTRDDGDRFIVQYEGVGRFSPSTGQSYQFEMILYPNGRILFQYLTMDGLLDSATIGIQNETRDIGLQVVYNSDYMHDNLAVEIFRVPDWLTVDPMSGVIPAGGYADVTLHLSAVGLEDGDHEGTVTLTSNDPFHGVVQVPVLLHVGEVELDYIDIDPNTLNLSSSGHTIRAAIQLPAEYDPHDIVLSTVSIYGTVFANPSPISYEDGNGDGVDELVVKFDRSAFEAVVPEGDNVPVTVTGEVRDTTWFTGTDTVRTVRPHVYGPNGGEYLSAGETVRISWQAPQLEMGVTYDIFLTRDGGNSWEPIGTVVGSTTFDWVVSGAATSSARVRVYASDNQGVMGYDTSDAPFTIATLLGPPLPATDLQLAADPTDVIFEWKRPLTTLENGPAEWYRVYQSSSPQGPFDEIAEVYEETLRDPHTNHQGATILYFKVVAGNGAGASGD